eukprot:CAMPEP_0185751116 /NCGR_PEP_ID=MMETSP1174-20130828/9869_1 /TAXON_ID=35687 /ORGANISM="Dictyocha speculum, Strain CCMP1381" /LENGTH=49 /DNA_ID=CAMNT_0028427941 /DNA_START=229 /DNA_END=378 /DNA_ORIENTATION=+
MWTSSTALLLTSNCRSRRSVLANDREGSRDESVDADDGALIGAVPGKRS